MPYVIKAAIKLFLDMLFPRSCISCKRHLEDVEISGPVCKFCFDRIAINRSLPIREGSAQIFSLGSYNDETLRKLIHAFKYDRIKTASETIEALIDAYLDKHPAILGLQNSIIVPIPLHPKKERERGFNQAEVIGQILSAKIGIKIETGILKRIKNTKPQAHFAKTEDRALNISQAFKATEGAREKISGKNIVLVDDVYTSGSTVKEAVKILKENGAKKFTIFVLAKTS